MTSGFTNVLDYLPFLDRLTFLAFYTFVPTNHHLTIIISGLILKAHPPYSCS